MVLATGIIKAIATARPTITVDVLASTRNAAVLNGNPHVGSVITIDKRRPWTYLNAIWRVRSTRYDAVVDSMVLSPSLTTTLLSCLSGARHRIGVGGRGNDSTLTLPVPAVEDAVHYIDRSAALLAAFGLEPRRQMPAKLRADAPGTVEACSAPLGGWGIWKPELFLTSLELREAETHWHFSDMMSRGASKAIGRQRLVVNISASTSTKCWPVGCFVATIAYFRKAFPEVAILVIGAPQDHARMAHIAGEAGVQVAFTSHYRQMMAIVASSDVVLTPDTAVTHIASAFMKPAVVMFVGKGAACYGPYGTFGRVISSAGPSLEQIEVDPVIRALEALIVAARQCKILRLPASRLISNRVAASL
jgi:ADP-heptose:LPS heptosyltransferase